MTGVVAGEYTPGPWRFDGDWYRLPTIFGANSKRVAIIEKTGVGRDSHTLEQEADARLIAAAPDLLAALSALMAIETADVDMDEFGDDESVGAYQDQDTGEVKDLPLTFGHLRRARAAIASATGAA